MSSLRQRVIEQAQLMSGGAPVAPEQFAHVSDADDQPSTATKPADNKPRAALRPAGEPSNPALAALPQYLRAPVTAAVGEALAEQELVHEANGVIITPADAVRFLRPRDFVGQDGKPDLDAIRTALQDLAVSRPHLAARQRRREAAADSGQGAGQGVDSMQSRVAAMTALMNSNDPRHHPGATEVEHYRR